jgi:hypothetical protein
LASLANQADELAKQFDLLSLSPRGSTAGTLADP